MLCKEMSTLQKFRTWPAAGNRNQLKPAQTEGFLEASKNSSRAHLQEPQMDILSICSISPLEISFLCKASNLCCPKDSFSVFRADASLNSYLALQFNHSVIYEFSDSFIHQIIIEACVSWQMEMTPMKERITVFCSRWPLSPG